MSQLECEMMPRITVINSKHSVLANPNELMIPGDRGLQTAYINMEICFSAGADSCNHRVRYADGRVSIIAGESICKMFIMRRRAVHEHFKAHESKLRVRTSRTGSYLTVAAKIE